MRKTEIEQFRKKLDMQRQESVEFLRQIETETRSLDTDETQDAADQCVSSTSKETLFQQSSQRRTVLRRIDEALRRIEDGSFGECANCGGEIPSLRLQALPWTQFCLRCQEEIEREGRASFPAPSFALPLAAWKRAG
jgi:DnaK suppressor protein